MSYESVAFGAAGSLFQVSHLGVNGKGAVPADVKKGDRVVMVIDTTEHHPNVPSWFESVISKDGEIQQLEGNLGSNMISFLIAKQG